MIFRQPGEILVVRPDGSVIKDQFSGCLKNQRDVRSNTSIFPGNDPVLRGKKNMGALSFHR